MDKELLEAIRQVVREEVSGIKRDVSSLKDNVSGLKDDVSGLKERLSGIERQLKENTNILRALEHNSEVHKAEIDNLKHQVAKLAGNEEKINKIEDDLKNHSHDIVINTEKANVS